MPPLGRMRQLLSRRSGQKRRLFPELKHTAEAATSATEATPPTVADGAAGDNVATAEPGPAPAAPGPGEPSAVAGSIAPEVAPPPGPVGPGAVAEGGTPAAPSAPGTEQSDEEIASTEPGGKIGSEAPASTAEADTSAPIKIPQGEAIAGTSTAPEQLAMVEPSAAAPEAPEAAGAAGERATSPAADAGAPPDCRRAGAAARNRRRRGGRHLPAAPRTAEATVGALDLSGLAVASVEGHAEGLAVSGEAAPGIPDARDVTIKAAEAEAKTLYVAGEAPPVRSFASMRTTNLVGEARAGADGTWLLEAEKDVPVGEVVFRAEVAPEPGATRRRPIVEASAPFMRYRRRRRAGAGRDRTSGDARAALADARCSDAELRDHPARRQSLADRAAELWPRHQVSGDLRGQPAISIRNPHRIYPGQVFVIPTRDRSWETATAVN